MKAFNKALTEHMREEHKKQSNVISLSHCYLGFVLLQHSLSYANTIINVVLFAF